MSLADLRKDYKQATLSETEVDKDPVSQFARWFEQATQADVPEPNAMSLATADHNGRPSSRIVLIKEFDQRGFCWFTNYDSKKGDELAGNPYAALLFHWVQLERQVRIEGKVERLTVQESDAYFNSRPLGSRQSALASEQSRPVPNRAALEAKLAEVVAQYGEQPPRPEHWGGYRLVPDRLEFWQGRSSRLHDRIVYTRNADGSWSLSRLQP
ncbi:pyridoxamine 5'-phosphate oxidase [Undibacterium terreum]|uniref:Pyridoxine/pyridoxamine 5'-phosphate oxidase n=1 Tax=Undibacterium terreum TaxID=1224302 RepID=A0A916UMT0_9BURK|nr:pyridoxamine 5'-phosphate oxidase [Undibacterium terreum]GGC78784.1 pyridoxine/pyridoxamine 5'-phosphate oxidase [Undibacterium terreum]